ncbi:MAG: phosphatase PAP2 family protein [Mycobacteriales bacterium]
MSSALATSDPGEWQLQPPGRAHTWRRGAMSCYAAAFVAQWMYWGFPTDTVLIFAWLMAAAVCWNIGQPWRCHLQWIRDWGPILGLLLVYDLSRGIAENGRVPHVTEMITIDKALFDGQLPTVWLQQHFYDPRGVHWWDVFGSFVYMSHFVVSLGVAIVLWLHRRRLWAAFMRRWFFLAALGVVTFFLYPAAPPWWAAKSGYIAESVPRISTRGWGAIGLEGTGRLLNHGQAMSNPVAAMPSLHSAFAALVAVFLAGLVAKKWWPLLLAYPLVMTLTLVYSGEHYVTDVLVGWAYVGVSWFAVSCAERWWRAHRAHVSVAATPVSPPVSFLPVPPQTAVVSHERV